MADWSWDAADIDASTGPWYWTSDAAEEIYEELRLALNQRAEVIGLGTDYFSTDYTYPLLAYRSLMSVAVTLSQFFLRSHADNGDQLSPTIVGTNDWAYWDFATVGTDREWDICRTIWSTKGAPNILRGVTLPDDPLDFTDAAFSSKLMDEDNWMTTGYFGPWIPWFLREVLDRMIWLPVEGEPDYSGGEVWDGSDGDFTYADARSGAVSDYAEDVGGFAWSAIAIGESYEDGGFYVVSLDKEAPDLRPKWDTDTEDEQLAYPAFADGWLYTVTPQSDGVFDDQGVSWVLAEGWNRWNSDQLTSDTAATAYLPVPMDITNPPDSTDPSPSGDRIRLGFEADGESFGGNRYLLRYDAPATTDFIVTPAP